MDRKRFGGPDGGSFPYHNLQKCNVNSPNAAVKNNKSEFSSLTRPVYLRTGLITQANGSAYLEIPSSSLRIVAAVHGPRQSQKKETFKTESTVYCTVDFLPFASKSRTPMSGVTTSMNTSSMTTSSVNTRKSLSLNLERWLMNAIVPSIITDRYPKSNIDIFITVLQTEQSNTSDNNSSYSSSEYLNASLFAAALNCASLALADAGIELYDLTASTYAVMVDKKWVVDASPEQCQNASAEMIVGLMPAVNTVTGVIQRGLVDGLQSTEGVDCCIDVCSSQVYALMKQCLTNTTNK